MKGFLYALLAVCALGAAVYAADKYKVTVYADQTLAARTDANWTVRIDTVAIDTSYTGQTAFIRHRPDWFEVYMAGTTQGTAADSLFYVLVQGIVNGDVVDIGEDSLMMVPRTPSAAGTQVGEYRRFAFSGDTLRFKSVNKKASTVTNTSLSLNAVHTP